MIKNFLGNYKLSYRLTHPREWFVDLFREIRAFIQRGCRGYADSDTWDLNDYLCEWLPKALRHLAKHSHGCAPEFFDKIHKDDECWRWKRALIRMAEGFEAKKKVLRMEWVNESGHEALNEKWKKEMKLFIEYFDSLWD